MKKKQKKTLIRIDDDILINFSIDQAKKALQTKTNRSRISDREALRYIIQNNNGGALQLYDVLTKNFKVMKETCCIHFPKLKSFPWEHVIRLAEHYTDNHLTRDEIKGTLMTLVHKGDIVDDQIQKKIKEDKYK